MNNSPTLAVGTSFLEKYQDCVEKHQSMLCVGLDPDPERLPIPLQKQTNAIFSFCQHIVDATADLVCAFKPQIAYFSSIRAEDQLERLVAYIHQQYPHIPVILDAKRGDIGSTATQYAIEAYERYGADAVTVNPYMGFDSLEPYLRYPDKGVIVLCRTSNPGGSDLQFLETRQQNDTAMTLYERVAMNAAKRWNTNGQMGLVVGATFPEEIAKVRNIVGDMPLLVPGIGAQGGDVLATVLAGQGKSLIINSSRAILYASNGEDFASAARQVALKTRDEINQARAQCAS